MTAIAVTVVPIPRWAGFRIAARKMSLLAIEIDSTNSAAVGNVVTGSRRSVTRDAGGGGDVVEALADAVDRDLAGDLAGLVAAHAVGDDERGAS